MNRLANIPLWFWYAFSVAYCYLLWNPWFSFWQMMQGDLDPAIKAVVAFSVLIVAALYVVEGHRSMNIIGIVLFFGFIGSMMWVAFNHGARFQNYEWWGQWIIGGFMTIALQGGRIYRSLTGRVPVGTGGTEHTGHHNG